jgi:FkbM family methyltransferase
MYGTPIQDILQVDLPTVHVVDVGAMQEGEDRYAGLVAHGLARVTGFEPNPGQFHVLSTRQEPYRYLPFCLGDGNPATMHAARYPGCSSLYEPDPAVIDLFTGMDTGAGGNFHIFKTLILETHRLDDVPDLGRVDLMKLDVQGAELDVLRHGTAVLGSTLVLECEVEFLPLYKGQPLFGDVHTFLAARGFVLHKLVDVGGRCLRPIVINNNTHAPISQMLFADAIFMRDFTRLELFASEELLKTAMILHEVYFSYDVAVHFLREHDRRTGTELARRYTEQVFRQANLAMMYLNLKLDA